jgi:hypothetical protein
MDRPESIINEYNDYGEAFCTVEDYIRMAYAAGLDDGIKLQRVKHANNMQKPVIQINEDRKHIKTWNSINEACRAFHVSKSAIRTAMKTKNKSCGFYWRAA